MAMATSGLVSAIHCLVFSKPEKTRFQYGSSVCLLSIAAPMAGTCDEASPAMIFATVLLPLLWGFGFRALGWCLLCRLVGSARLRAVAFDRAPAFEHHLRIVVLRRPCHHGGKVAERVTAGRAKFGGEINVPAEFEHPVVVALEDRVGLLGRERILLEVFGFIRLEGLAVLVLHQRHAEHID